MRQLRPGPHRPCFPDRGAEGRQEGPQGVPAEEALSVDVDGLRKLGFKHVKTGAIGVHVHYGQSPGSVDFHDITAISASLSEVHQDSS